MHTDSLKLLKATHRSCIPKQLHSAPICQQDLSSSRLFWVGNVIQNQDILAMYYVNSFSHVSQHLPID